MPWQLPSIWVLCQQILSGSHLADPALSKETVSWNHLAGPWPGTTDNVVACTAHAQKLCHCFRCICLGGDGAALPILRYTTLSRFLMTSCLQGFWHRLARHILSLKSSGAICLGANVHLALAEAQAAKASLSALAAQNESKVLAHVLHVITTTGG